MEPNRYCCQLANLSIKTGGDSREFIAHKRGLIFTGGVWKPWKQCEWRWKRGAI